MALDREAVFVALFERLTPLLKAAGVVTFSRRVIPASRVTPEMQPAVYLVKGNEAPKQARDLSPQWSLSAELYVYCSAKVDMNGTPKSASTLMNQVLTAIEASLELQTGEVETPSTFEPHTTGTTLNGKVSHCWIGPGEVMVVEGPDGEQSVMIVPLDLLAVG